MSNTISYVGQGDIISIKIYEKLVDLKYVGTAWVNIQTSTIKFYLHVY